MFGIGGSSAGAKKKGKQATKGDAQIVKDNVQTIEFYKKILTIVNAAFLGVHLIFYFITGFPTYSFILFAITSGIAWYVWSFMKQIGSGSASGVTDLNLEGSISEYAKDIILVISLTQVLSLIHRYFWWFLLVIPIYAAYKGIMLFFFSPYAQLRGGANQEQDAEQDNKKGKRITKVVRH